MSNTDSDPAYEPSFGSRKQQRNPDLWKNGQAKKKLNTIYVYTIGKPGSGEVPAHTISLPCHDGYFQQVVMENLRQIFTEFMGLHRIT